MDCKASVNVIYGITDQSSVHRDTLEQGSPTSGP